MSDSPAGPPGSDEDPISAFDHGIARWLPTLQVLVLCILLFVLVRGVTRAFLQSQEPVSGKQRVEVEAKGKDLQVLAWLNQDRVSVGSTVRVWFTLTNTTEKPLDVKVALFEAPGFGKPPLALKGFRGFPFYLAGSGRPITRQELTLPLSPKGSGSFRAEISPSRASGSSMVTTLLSWQDATGAEQIQPIELGPIRSTSPGFQFAGNAVETLMTLIESLAVPIALALLAWFLKWLDEKRQAQTQRQAETRQAWASMLPVSHKLNAEVYIPVLSDVATFLDRLDECRAKAEKEETCQEAFFFLLKSLCGMNKSPALFLKSQKGEQVVQLCWDTFTKRVREELRPYVDLASALDSLKPGDTFAKYSKTRNQTDLEKKVRDLEKALETWFAKRPADFKLVELFVLLLGFEVNRIYEFWYEEGRQEFPRDECQRLLAELVNFGDVKGVEEYKDSFYKPVAEEARLRDSPGTSD